MKDIVYVCVCELCVHMILFIGIVWVISIFFASCATDHACWQRFPPHSGNRAAIVSGTSWTNLFLSFQEMEAQMDAATGSPLLASRVDNIHALVAGDLSPPSNFSISFSISHHKYKERNYKVKHYVNIETELVWTKHSFAVIHYFFRNICIPN